MILYPNAKVNIGLHITEKRNDGYHNIDSIFYPIPWMDILEITPAKRTSFTYSGDPVDPMQNSVVNALHLLRQHYNFGEVHIHLHKQIPQGAGLGGGSSDATFCLIGLNKLFHLGLSNEQLSEHALTLGSDCPFFLFNKAARVKGRGEIIEPIESRIGNLYIKLIYPDIHISTVEAFSMIHPKRTSLEIKEHTLTKSTLEQLQNDFEIPISERYPRLRKLHDQLKKEGAIYTSMSGSGSTIYGLFEDKPEINEHLPNQRVFQLKQP